MEEVAKNVSLQLSLIVEILGAVIIGIGLIQFVVGYISKVFHKKQYLYNALLRVKFGSILALSLELLLAADILRTAVAPSWEDIGKLAAIAAIRTAMNYFLERELKEIEDRVEENKVGMWRLRFKQNVAPWSPDQLKQAILRSRGPQL